jgi:hypothetical protein
MAKDVAANILAVFLLLILPTVFLVVLWRRRYVTKIRVLFLSVGGVVAVGVLTWFFLFGKVFIAVADLFFVLNIPLYLATRAIAGMPLDQPPQEVDYVLPFLVYPLCGYVIGFAMDCLRRGSK